MKTHALTATIVAAAAATTTAQLSDIVYTNERDATIDSFIGGSGGTLAASANPGARLAGIVLVGGDFFFADGAANADPTLTSGFFRLSDPFGAATIAPVSTGLPIENPIGVQWDAGRGNFITINNPVSPGATSVDGILGITPGGTVSTIFEEDLSIPRPRYQGAARLAPDPAGTGYLVPSPNGSGAVVGPGELGTASALFRIDIDGSLSGSQSLIVDLGDTAVTGLADPLLDTAGVTVNPSTGLVYLTDRDAGAIYELTLDGAGAFDSIRVLVDGLDEPEEIQYDPFNDRLVFDENRGSDLGRISQVELDGTGLTLLVDDVDTRGIAIVPAPATLALLGLGGLAAARRRR
ncbi:MAG: PEP-CTERM sorting domain-containing protein [Planctomycetota bacterium]